MYFDTHVHLNSEQYENVEKIIDRALENNVRMMAVVGYDIDSSLKAVELANRYDFLYAIIGIHPSEASTYKKDDLGKIEKLCNNKKVVGIGEIGLDYHWEKDNKEKQKELFVRQILLAEKYNLPIVIHSRDAAEDTYKILDNYKKHFTKGIMHCYSYSLEMAYKFIDLGFYLSFGGSLTFLNAKQNREVVKNIPIEKILIETDAPYLAPHPYRGKINEPMYIGLVVDEIAKIKNMEEKEVGNITFNNACYLFGIQK